MGQFDGTDHIDKVINIVTDDGFQATTFTGGTCSIGGVIRDVGLTFTCRPYIRRDEVMLISTLTLTELVSPAIAAVQAVLGKSALGYTESLGIPSLRARIARHYAETYRVPVSADRVIVTTGSSAGFILAFLAMFEPGDRVAIANPGYPPNQRRTGLGRVHSLCKFRQRGNCGDPCLRPEGRQSRRPMRRPGHACRQRHRAAGVGPPAQACQCHHGFERPLHQRPRRAPV
jgi:hypothetical protein